MITNLVGAGAILRDESVEGDAILHELEHQLQTVLASTQTHALDRTDAAIALGKLGAAKTYWPASAGAQYLTIPRGTFSMGSDQKEGCLGYEAPRHDCLLGEYKISRLPVSQAQFQEFVDDDGYRNPAYWAEAESAGVWINGLVCGDRDADPRGAPWRFNHDGDLPNAPVVGVTWYECLAYARWLTEKLRRSGDLTAEEALNLPSEAQYEKAAGEGVYPCGDNIDGDQANYAETGLGRVTPTGCFPRGRSPYGVEELSGNVWEWTRTLWLIRNGRQVFRYPYDPQDGREDPSAGPAVARVLRGAACYNLKTHMRRSVRDCGPPSKWSEFVSFRLVVESAE